MTRSSFREPGAAQAGGWVLAVACLLVVIGPIFHPLPSGGFEEKPSVLQNTPWWGPIHIAIAAGFALCVLGGVLMLFAGGELTRHWAAALSWACITVGMMLYFLEPLIYANVPAFLWLGYYGLRISSSARRGSL